MSDLAALDKDIRFYIYKHIVETIQAPAQADVAQALEIGMDEVQAAYARMADAHTLVLEATTGEVRMAMPFSAVPTPFEVMVEDKVYWANCAWDALGIAAALHKNAQIKTSCPDCQQELQYIVKDSKLLEGKGLIHFALPALRWWDDIVFT